MKQKNLTDIEVNLVIQIIVNNYQLFDNDIVDLVNASGLSIKQADKIVRRRYKDFIIN